MEENLEGLIKRQSEAIAAKMASIAHESRSEEDVRHGCNRLIDGFIEDAGLEVRGRHEYGLAGGRVDSKYGGVIIEYKDPRGSARLTNDSNSPGVKSVAAQIEKRFADFEAEERIERERILAVGCDGKTIIFVRYRGRTIEVESPKQVTPHTVERLLRALVSLGARGYSFTPDNLCEHFGADGNIALEGVSAIYKVLSETDSPKAQVFFKQWRILFGEVCGYDVQGRNTKVMTLGRHYRIPNSRPADLLFSVHTYYAILIKLLAAEIVSSISPLGASILKRLHGAETSEKLRSELEILEGGGIWSQLGIRNFLEGDLFAWYLDAWNEELADVIRKMVRALDQYDPTTLSVEPAESRDLLKKLYQHLFPRSVRHDLGEYYTPDWLADLTLDDLGYDGNPDKRILDPACGSGTFLVMALNRIRAWFSEHRHECGFGETELLEKILENVIGFDLNPLAVMAARTNYLLSIRDLLRHSGGLELPVYLCDAILTPAKYGDLFTGDNGNVSRILTSVGEFLIPNEVTRSRAEIVKYSETLEFCVRSGFSQEEFLERCKAEGIKIREASLHKQLYRQLRELDAENQNGIWARIIKNSFAPLFIGKVDFVAGNPPWINWESLPEDYRDSMKPLWVDYGLFTLSGSAGRLGGGKKDLSMLFLYTSVDNYLAPKGKLGFVITQTIFKTQGAGDGFRRLRFTPKDETFYIKPLQIHDLSEMQVFEGATNRAAVFVCEKQKRPFKYPVSYTAWSGPSRITQSEPLESVLKLTKRVKLGAIPVVEGKETAPWLTAPPKALSGVRKVLGKSHYQAFAGCCAWLNGVYWVRVIKEWHDGNLVIENLHDVGKLKLDPVEAVIEPDLVYPLLRGRDVNRWSAEPSCHIILAQDPETRRGIPESDMKVRLPKTFAYLRKFEGSKDKPERGTLRGRSGYLKYFSPSDPFYSMYNVGPYTMAQWKVVWREQSSVFQASVIGPKDSQVVCPDHKLMLVPCGSEEEANYLTAILNSAPSLLAIRSYVISTSTSTHVLENVKVPVHDRKSKTQRRLATLSRICHEATAKEDRAGLRTAEREIDELAAEVWSIGARELSAIGKALG